MLQRRGVERHNCRAFFRRHRRVALRGRFYGGSCGFQPSSVLSFARCRGNENYRDFGRRDTYAHRVADSRHHLPCIGLLRSRSKASVACREFGCVCARASSTIRQICGFSRLCAGRRTSCSGCCHRHRGSGKCPYVESLARPVMGGKPVLFTKYVRTQ